MTSSGERPSNKDAGLAVLAGVATGLSQPFVLGAISSEPIDPTGLSGMLALVGVVPLLVITAGRSLRQVLGLALLAWWVHFIVVAHWLTVAFTAFAGAPPVVGVAAMLAATAVHAVPLALPVVLAQALRSQRGWPLWVTFPAAFSAVELLRNYVPVGGSPWANLGNSLATVDILRQTASVVGVYGLVFVVGLMNAALAEAWLRGRSDKLALRGLVITGAVFVAMIGWGAWRLSHTTPAAQRLSVGLLQASIPQEVINAADAAAHEDIRETYQHLQDAAQVDGARVVVWPEAALVPMRDRDSEFLREEGIAPMDRATSLPLELFTASMPETTIVGSITSFREMDEVSGRLVRGLHTSAFVANRALEVKDRHDKTRLVPFGEYVPWPFHLVMGKLISDSGEVIPGATPRPVQLPLETGPLLVGVTICYEGAFPEISRELVDRGARQLYNLTNDAWYGVTGEPYQHLAMYQLRATEVGRAVARAANSGVSAVIDTRGRVIAKTKLGERRPLVVKAPVSEERTPYLLLGDWLAWLSLLFSLAAVGAALLGRRQSRDST